MPDQVEPDIYPDFSQPDYVSFPVALDAWAEFVVAAVEAQVTAEGIPALFLRRVRRKALDDGASFTRQPRLYRVLDPAGAKVAANGTGLTAEHVQDALRELTVEARMVAAAIAPWAKER